MASAIAIRSDKSARFMYPQVIRRVIPHPATLSTMLPDSEAPTSEEVDGPQTPATGDEHEPQCDRPAEASFGAIGGSFGGVGIGACTRCDGAPGR